MNMKYKYTPLIAIVLLACFCGCKKDFLDTKIDTFDTPNTIVTNRATLFSFANAFYQSLPSGFNVLDGNLFANATDEAQASVYSPGAMIFNQGVLNSFNNPIDTAVKGTSSYKNFYNGIRAANYFLSYSNNAKALLALNRDTITDVVNYNNDKQNVKWYRAEAHIARAYYYSELIKRYGGVPLIKTALPITQMDNPQVAKSSYDDVVSFIVSEVDAYKDSLQLNWKTSSFTGNFGRFSKGGALALKARVLLYAASPLHNASNDVTKWQAAAAAARDVMTTTGLNYALDANYATYFTGSNPLGSNETIFLVERAADNALEKANYPVATAGGKTGLTPTQNLVADYEYTGAPNATNPYVNRDPRLAASVVTNNSTWNNRVINESAGGTDDMANTNASKTGYYLKKFLTDNLNLTQGATAQHHWILFRYAEVLLNYAEAMNEAYGPDVVPAGFTMSARQALMLVRNRASASLPAVTAAGTADFRTALKHERRIELVFEDHRYWDLLRWKDAAIVLNQPVKGVKVTAVSAGVYTYQDAVIASRVFTNAMYYFPFTQAEISNSKGTLQQNPGY